MIVGEFFQECGVLGHSKGADQQLLMLWRSFQPADQIIRIQACPLRCTSDYECGSRFLPCGITLAQRVEGAPDEWSGDGTRDSSRWSTD
jgi:hypothetical protein